MLFRSSIRPNTHDELESLIPHTLQELRGLEPAVSQHAHVESPPDRLRHGGEEIQGEPDRGRGAPTPVHAIPDWEFECAVDGVQDHEVNAVDAVLHANSGELLAGLGDAGEVDAQVKSRAPLAARGQQKRLPLRVLKTVPAGTRVPGVHVQETTEGTRADRRGTVKRCFPPQIEEHAERSLKAAPLIDRAGDGEQVICQNTSALPGESEVVHTLVLSSGSAF